MAVHKGIVVDGGHRVGQNRACQICISVDNGVLGAACIVQAILLIRIDGPCAPWAARGVAVVVYHRNILECRRADGSDRRRNRQILQVVVSIQGF